MSDQVLKVLQGLPGAGKSTWAAAWRALDPQRRVVVNRDGIRFEVFGRYRGLKDEQEAVVTGVEFLRVDRALGTGLSVTVDATHLKSAHRDRWVDLATRHGVRYELVVINTPLSECLRRNQARAAAGGRFVPEDVIAQMHATAELV
ncbi:AAA family ATPase [Mycolicibacterium goodii]|uniref:AAA family ATPase n=1 Tax=Mycolicibacterium goodii TaxID=134601 RepID=UPI001BDCBA46|nr:AAA family ATPase [Mycolicibacterium goodii]MBU8821068.1 AAA family ATPase [Mycolicibacterium goodii]